MKYCTKCGNELLDDAVICPKCGCLADGDKEIKVKTNDVSGLKTAAKVFMILSCVLLGIYLIPLCWCVPMTVSYCKKVKNGEPVGIGFKICCLLFVSVIGGVLMLCDND